MSDFSGGWQERIAEWALDKERIHEVYLFGSRAKGTHESDSDIGLAVVLTGSDPDERCDYAIHHADEWTAELEGLLAIEIDLEFAEPDTDTVVWPAVIEHGIRVYTKPGYISLKD